MTPSLNAQPLLLCFDADSGPQRVPLQQELLIGRSPDAHVTLCDEDVSPQHARLLFQGDDIFLEDLSSRTGTFLNSVVVRGRAPVLKPAQCIIRVGPFIFSLRAATARLDACATPSYFLEKVSLHAGMKYFRVHPHRTLVVGRLPGQDVVVCSDRASREHAHIFVDLEGRVLVCDLSTYGTFIQNRKIIKGEWSQLKTNYMIRFADVSFRLVAGFSRRTSSTEPLESLSLHGASTQFEDAIDDIFTAPVAEDAPANIEQTGDYSILDLGAAGFHALADVIGPFSLEDRPAALIEQLERWLKEGMHEAGTFYVSLGQGDRGVIPMRQRQLSVDYVHIERSDGFMVAGRKAFFRLMCMRSRELTFDPTPPGELSMMHELSGLFSLTPPNYLLEARQQLDKMHELLRRAAPQDELEIKIPLRPRLRDLEPQLLAVFQHAVNLQRVQRVLDAYPDRDDIAILGDLVQLISLGYLQKSA